MMNVFIKAYVGYNWILNVVDSNNNVVHTITDTQEVLNFQVKYQNRLKKRKGVYTMQLDLKEYNELINGK